MYQLLRQYNTVLNNVRKVIEERVEFSDVNVLKAEEEGYRTMRTELKKGKSK